jgi:ferrous iron transport protein A
MLLPLDCLHSGEWGEIAEVTGEPRLLGRLSELGVRAGCLLKVLQPGSPCLLELSGCRLSLRTDDAMHIYVRPVAVAV